MTSSVTILLLQLAFPADISRKPASPAMPVGAGNAYTPARAGFVGDASRRLMKLPI